MSNFKPRSLAIHSSLNPISLLILLLATQPSSLLAQVQHPPSPASPTQAAPTTLDLEPNPTSGDALFSGTAVPSGAIPSAIDNANYGSNGSNSDKGVLNYYFLLLAVFIVIIALAYWSLARRRRNKIARLRYNQQTALARDLETWPGRRRGVGRWRFAGMGGHETRVEEGLDERGEAPPPYLAKPEPVHHGVPEIVGEEEGTELRHMEGKPPDYQEGPTRPAVT
ncbi:hypothetical protein MMC28_001249 [Mycoblastus sanguinarius]|nr:hypothetical protein [Mycoblastus sanguinarius]